VGITRRRATAADISRCPTAANPRSARRRAILDPTLGTSRPAGMYHFRPLTSLRPVVRPSRLCYSSCASSRCEPFDLTMSRDLATQWRGIFVGRTSSGAIVVPAVHGTRPSLANIPIRSWCQQGSWQFWSGGPPGHHGSANGSSGFSPRGHSGTMNIGSRLVWCYWLPRHIESPRRS
jgi:hypothetical protein